MIFQKKKTIVTHSGRFHADDLFAVSMLLEYLGDAKVVRSVDQKVIEKADFVVDVGRIYDSQKNRFDHHQGGVGARENSISYASAGLVWKHLGEKITGSREVALKIDEKLVAPIDAFDTGDVSPKPIIEDIYPYVLDNMTGAFSSTWKEAGRDETPDFMFLIPFARAILKREIVRAQAAIEGEKMIVDAYDKAEDKRFVVVDMFHPPLGALEDMPDVLYVISREKRSNGWVVFAVRKNKNEYGNRKDLPKEWAGKSDGELAAVSGVSDAIFCHLKLFLAVAKSREGAIALAKKAIEA